MYEPCYGLSENPFRMSLDARFSFHHHSYVEVREYLDYGLSQDDGTLILLGEPGIGKSTVVNDLLVNQASPELLVAKLAAPPSAVSDLFQLLAYSLDVKTDDTDKSTILKSVENFLKDLYAAGRHALLVVDDAENIPEQGLEELRLLAEMRQHDQPMLQVLLQGHLKLSDIVRNSSRESLRQLIMSSIQLNPMDFEETHAYIQHRLSVVGWHGDPGFSDQAIEVIHQFSAGVPRQVNVICNHILLYGGVEQIHRFDDHDVRQVIEELPPDMIKSNPVRAQAPLNRRPKATAKPPRKTEFSYDKERSASAKTIRENDLSPTLTRQHTPALSAPNPENTKVTSSPTKARYCADSNQVPSPPIQLNTREMQTALPTSRQLSRSSTRPKQKRSASSDAPSNHRVDSPLSKFNAGAATTIARLRSPAAVDPHQSIGIEQHHPRRRSAMHSLVATIVLAGVLGGPYIYHALPSGESDGLTMKDFNSPPTVYNDLTEPQWIAQKDQSTLGKQSQGDDWRQWLKDLPDSDSKATPIMIDEFTPSSLADADATNAWPNSNKPPGVDFEDNSSPLLSHAELVDNAPTETESIPVEINENKLESTTSAGRQLLNTSNQASLYTDNRYLSPTRSKLGTPSLTTDSGIETVDGKLVINRSLENALRRYSHQVERLSDGALIITLQREIAFESNNKNLTQTVSDTLDKLAFVLRNYDGFVLQIVIHTEAPDSMGENSNPADQRVQAIANYLIKRGIPANRVHYLLGQNANATDHQRSSFNVRSNNKVKIFVRPSA